MDFHDSNNNCSSSSGSTLLRQRSHAEFPRCFSPPEAVKKPDVSDADSPSSVNSSAFLMKARQCERWERAEREMEKVVVEVEEGGEVDSSFVIEIDSHCMGESEGSAAVDEAIAWAKEKYWNPVSRDEMQESKEGNQKGTKEAFDEHNTEEK